MKTAFRWLSLLLLLSHALCSVTNTTEFWRTQLGIPAGDMHFQCYSGTFASICRVRINQLVQTCRTVQDVLSAVWRSRLRYHQT